MLGQFIWSSTLIVVGAIVGSVFDGSYDGDIAKDWPSSAGALAGLVVSFV
jgi:hypothetical protein